MLERRRDVQKGVHTSQMGAMLCGAGDESMIQHRRHLSATVPLGGTLIDIFLTVAFHRRVV